MSSAKKEATLSLWWNILARSYQVVCEQAAGDTRPYPLCSDSNWGPGAPVRQYGLVPSHKDAILTAPNGRAEVSFTKTRDTRLYAKLTREGMDEDTLERCVSVREQDDKVFVTIQLPTRGEYGLEIYANEPDREGDTFTHVCQYLASYIDRDPGSVYGQAFDKADFTYGQVSGPVIYPSRAGQFANQDGNKSMGGPPGKQVYQTSSQDWEGNMLTHQSYRSETEAVPGGIRTVTQSQVNTRIKVPLVNNTSFTLAVGYHENGTLKMINRYILKADSRFAPSQWETALLCKDVSHWLGANLESALYFAPQYYFSINAQIGAVVIIACFWDKKNSSFELTFFLWLLTLLSVGTSNSHSYNERCVCII